MAVWTHGRWTVRRGREEDFVAALRRLVADVQAEIEGAPPSPTLLRDREQPNRFLTFGRWESIEAVERFREFALPRIRELDDLLEGVEILTLDEVAVE